MGDCLFSIVQHSVEIFASIVKLSRLPYPSSYRSCRSKRKMNIALHYLTQSLPKIFLIGPNHCSETNTKIESESLRFSVSGSIQSIVLAS